MPDVVVEADADRLARAAAEALVARLSAAQAVHGTVSVVLTGGGIGIAVLEHVAGLAAEPVRETVDWEEVEVWWGDERFVPAGDDERNEKQAREALLSRVGVPDHHIHAMPPSDGDFAEPEDAAAWYADQLRAAAPTGRPFRGWTCCCSASVRRGTWPRSSRSPRRSPTERTVVAVRDCPKPPPTRVSLGYAAINAAEEIWLLVSGTAKAPAVARALSGADPTDLPAAGVHGTRATRWLLDAAAASQVPPRTP